MVNVVWTDKIISDLKRLWADRSLSASQIATRLGEGVSRNAVIGKVHRLGLPGRVACGGGRKRPSVPRDMSAKREAELAQERQRKLQEMAALALILEAEIAASQAAEAARQAEASRIALAAAVAISPAPLEVLRVSEIQEVFETSMEIGVSIFELQTQNKKHGIVGTCRWPLGEPKEIATRFCGEPPLPGRPYCACHCRMAFSAMRPRRVAAQPVDVGAIPGATSLNRVFGAHTI